MIDLQLEFSPENPTYWLLNCVGDFPSKNGGRIEDGSCPDWRYDGNPATHNINTEGNVEFRFNRAGDLSTSGQRLGAMLLTTGRGVCAGVGKLGECIIP